MSNDHREKHLSFVDEIMMIIRKSRAASGLSFKLNLAKETGLKEPYLGNAIVAQSLKKAIIIHVRKITGRITTSYFKGANHDEWYNQTLIKERLFLFCDLDKEAYQFVKGSDLFSFMSTEPKNENRLVIRTQKKLTPTSFWGSDGLFKNNPSIAEKIQEYLT